MNIPDIDIDFPDRQAAINLLGAIPAMILRDNRKIAHNSSAYLQNVPIDPFTGLCSIDYESAEGLGYYKIDFLNQTVYKQVRDEEHLLELMNREPAWELLDDQSFVDQLPHLRNHYNIVRLFKPTSLEDIAIVLAIMRPGKKHLLGKTRAEIEKEIWTPTEAGFVFRRSHAYAYSALVIVAMNQLCERLLSE